MDFILTQDFLDCVTCLNCTWSTTTPHKSPSWTWSLISTIQIIQQISIRNISAVFYDFVSYRHGAIRGWSAVMLATTYVASPPVSVSFSEAYKAVGLLHLAAITLKSFCVTLKRIWIAWEYTKIMIWVFGNNLCTMLWHLKSNTWTFVFRFNLFK